MEIAEAMGEKRSVARVCDEGVSVRVVVRVVFDLHKRHAWQAGREEEFVSQDSLCIGEHALDEVVLKG